MKYVGINLCIAFALSGNVAFPQFFEGKVMYAHTYKSKLPAMPDQQFSTMMGTTQEYMIKGGNYKSVVNGMLLQWQIYNQKDNRLYTKMSNSDAVFFKEGAASGDELINVEVNKNVIEVLGYLCDELILTTKTGVQKYYFNNQYKVDARLYEGHKVYNWYDFVSRSNAVPLKIILDNPQFVLESLAVEIIPMKLDDKLFELPAGSKLEKSPF